MKETIMDRRVAAADQVAVSDVDGGFTLPTSLVREHPEIVDMLGKDRVTTYADGKPRDERESRQ